VWKIHPDGSGAVQILSATAVIPDVSRDGRYVAYLTNRRTPMATVHVASLADGKDVPFSVAVGIPGQHRALLTTGRTRWTADGKAIAYIGQNEQGHFGVYVQEFAPGRDTMATRRELAGFDPETATESFALSADGKRLTTAGWEQLSSILVAERVPGVSPPRRRSP
jgi:Tol biopolymer transport system component